ncbi:MULTISPECIES: hypothetical protein [unclassified Corallococcus]|uniref:hypothetical protein n=1 Tax=unclassified Corallococcus TaxID=2685029 RepID=UPI001A8E75CC|nr:MULTISPECIES: hypothetical protein [unclassified Corallococcus]MBN9683937.1 hypothetical protein [Corallococcus sp. NCSPR001]WAS84563.1 hypothetical protein O0N60_35505 [Corallococcus sp. NCRR]
MELRTKLGAAALLAAAAMATAAGCGGRDDDNPTPTPDAGCTGVCSTDAGSDAGTNTDAGSDAGTGDAGTANQIAATRKLSFGTKATLRNVVVTDVDYEKLGNDGKQWRSFFWVTDPAAPTEGLYITKFYDDVPDTYRPQPGNTIDVEGFFGTEPNYQPFSGRRHHLANDYRNNQKLNITVKSDAGIDARPAANEVTAEQLQASLAAAQATAPYVGTRVHLAGPLTLTNPQPSQLQRLDKEDAGTLFYGFEVTGGILVYHDKTRSRTFSDGGTFEGCDFQKAALDGGAVTFPNGISGVWDTYTFAGCTNGSSDITGCGDNDRDSGVPGTDQRYTYTLIPQGCEDLPGEVAAPQ